LYYTLRIDADPTSWELTVGVERVPALNAPVVLPVYHPLKGDLVLSPQAVGSAVFLEYQLGPNVHGTRPNGYPIPKGGALYVPSPVGPDENINPLNLYPLGNTVDLAALQADIIAAMKGRTFLTVKVTGGEVVINGAEVPFAVLCPANG
jgi:hypothetical protein